MTKASNRRANRWGRPRCLPHLHRDAGRDACTTFDNARHAVTIIEIMAVIAVIALILGLLAPALSGAKASSRQTRCQSNLKQMATAAHAYATMYDAFPTAIRYENSGGVFRRIAWDWVTTFDGQVLSAGALWQFTSNPDDVQQCPEFEGSATFSGDPHTGYNYNTTYIGGEATFPQVGWNHVRQGIAPHHCHRGSRCAMFGDGGWKSGANKFMRAPLNSENVGLSAVYAGGQAFRHRGTTCIAFIDGHIGATRDALPGVLATQSLLDNIMAFPRNAFLSDDDAFYDPR
jgi:type II secretory pathway pseudopilin PulG